MDGYVLSSYVSSPDATPVSASVDRPCSLRGVNIVPTTDDTSVQWEVEFRDGSATGDILVKLNCGHMASENNSGEAKLFLTFPGLGVRFDDSIWVCGAEDGGTHLIHSVTIMYQ